MTSSKKINLIIFGRGDEAYTDFIKDARLQREKDDLVQVNHSTRTYRKGDGSEWRYVVIRGLHDAKRFDGYELQSFQVRGNLVANDWQDIAEFLSSRIRPAA